VREEVAVANPGKRLNQPDLLAAAIVGTVGATGLVLGRKLNWGSASALGPGYLPLGLSCILIGIAAVLVVRAFLNGEVNIAHFSVWPAAIITLATVAFGLMVERVGLVVTVFIVAMMSSFAGDRVSLSQRVLVPAVLAASCLLVFVYLLGQPIPVWWWSE
jgi:Tripartite tricarboxylate transporter TctB family